MATPRLKQLMDLLENSPADPFLIFAIAKEYEGMEEENSALKYYTLLVEGHPDYVGTYYHLGKLYEKRTSWAEALSTYSKGMEVAKSEGDRHSYSELSAAKMDLEEDLEADN